VLQYLVLVISSQQPYQFQVLQYGARLNLLNLQ